VRPRGVDDRHGGARVALHVAALLVRPLGVHVEMPFVGVDPDELGLRAAVGEERGEHGVVLAGGEVADLLVEHRGALPTARRACADDAGRSRCAARRGPRRRRGAGG